MIEALLCGLFLLLAYNLLRPRRTPAPYPPGPRPKPFIKNLFDVPLEKAALKYLELSKQLQSDIIHLSALNMHIVVLRTLEDTIELMERRSANYSERPTSPVTNLIGMENISFFLPYGKTWRKHRKLLDECLRKDIVPSYHHIQEEKVHLILEQLLDTPTKFRDHCKRLGALIVLSVAYGYDILPGKEDVLIDSAQFSGEVAAQLVIPGSTLIAVFGFLRYIPPWVPGASTQRLGAKAREAGKLYRNSAFEYAKEKTVSGTSKDCIVARFLESGDWSGEDEETLKDVMATFFIGGVETMKSLLIVFMLAMTLHPRVQEKAQMEIDKLLGTERLPVLDDRTSMPYVEALMREVARWRPIIPLGAGHASTNDDVYKGYYIPKGTIIFSNVWAITRNEEMYPDPEVFKPERFFKADGTLNDDNIDYAFGFGRRVCPGKYLGEDTVWLMMASVLATFNISVAKDENGKEIHVDANASTDGSSRSGCSREIIVEAQCRS